MNGGLVVGFALAQTLEAFFSGVNLRKDLRESRLSQETALTNVRYGRPRGRCEKANHDTLIIPKEPGEG